MRAFAADRGKASSASSSDDVPVIGSLPYVECLMDYVCRLIETRIPSYRMFVRTGWRLPGEGRKRRGCPSAITSNPVRCGGAYADVSRVVAGPG